MATKLLGRLTRSGSRDSEGYREYKIKWLVSGARTDGPSNVLSTPGLPVPGSAWAFDDDIDLWVWCRPDAVVQEVITDGDPVGIWHVEQVFSNKPLPADKQRCQDVPIEDPVLEPSRISGSFQKYVVEATKDRFSRDITNSAFEQIRGPQVEFDGNRMTVVIEQNMPTPYLGFIRPSQMIDRVNKYSMWGFPPRCIKLSDAPWERRFHGQCTVYWNRKLNFDISLNINPVTGALESGFDKDILDEGSKALRGRWGDGDADGTTDWVLIDVGTDAPNRYNSTHFIKVKDRNGENMRVILDGEGKPISSKLEGIVSGIQCVSGLVAVTSEEHGLSNGEEVAVSGVVETRLGTSFSACANDAWEVLVLDNDSFLLLGSEGCCPFGTKPDSTFSFTNARWRRLGETGAGNIHVEYYHEVDFFELLIPMDL